MHSDARSILAFSLTADMRVAVQLLASLESLPLRERSERLPSLDERIAIQQAFMQPHSKPPQGEFTWDARRKLGRDMANLNMDHAFGVLEILRAANVLPDDDGDEESEILIDMDALPMEALRKLQARC